MIVGLKTNIPTYLLNTQQLSLLSSIDLKSNVRTLHHPATKLLITLYLPDSLILSRTDGPLLHDLRLLIRPASDAFRYARFCAFFHLWLLVHTLGRGLTVESS